MNAKKIVSVILLAFVAASAGWLVVRQGQSSEDGNQSVPGSMEGATVSGPEAGADVNPDRVVVYYFHTTARCPTCHKIENYTREAVEQKFGEEIEEGMMEFRSVNIEEQGNKHFIKDYKLHTKSVVVSDMKSGKETRWKNLAKVWELVGNKENFFRYIEDEVDLYLQEK